MKQSDKKRKSPRIRWKIFGYMLIPTLFLIVMLWIAQTVLLRKRSVLINGRTKGVSFPQQNIPRGMRIKKIQM